MRRTPYPRTAVDSTLAFHGAHDKATVAGGFHAYERASVVRVTRSCAPSLPPDATRRTSRSEAATRPPCALPDARNPTRRHALFILYCIKYAN
ncbi:hypothetical protein BLAT2472_20142 [Burkholderia latens]